MTGTIGDLRAARKRMRELRDAVAVISNAGYYNGVSPDVLEELGELERASFAVPLSCLLCRQATLVAVELDDPQNAEPNAVICDLCEAKVDAAVAAAEGRPAGPSGQMVITS